MITLEDIKNNQEISMLLKASCDCLTAMSYTEHGLRHASYVSNTAYRILKEIGYDERLQELAKIAGYVHDVGNSVNRNNHGITGAILLYPIFVKMGMPLEDIGIVIAAIGNHEEEIGAIVNPVGAAVVIADKSDAHRTRVGRNDFDANDIHDRVNYAILKNSVFVDKGNKIISSKFYMNESSSVMDYFQIYLKRMIMSEKAARFLGCQFKLYINDVLINSPEHISHLESEDN